MQTVTQLFGGVESIGDRVCFYCGGRCDESHRSRDLVKSSFTGLDTVTLSEWVCSGCVAAMGEKASIELIDGERREGQKIRGYSWVVTSGKRIAATKAHLPQLRSVCLSPPDPPFAICLTDSGQRHLLYRGVVNRDRDPVTVSLEGELVAYQLLDLKERLDLCQMVCAATGKVALREPLEPQSQMRVVEHFADDRPLLEWLRVASEPLTRLAAWLCPPKQECLSEYPSVTAVG